MNITDSTATNNSILSNPAGAGIRSGGGSAPCVVRLSGVTIMSNFPNGMVSATSGAIVSFGNNHNSGTGTPNSTLPAQ
jgi:hypothetical protein